MPENQGFDINIGGYTQGHQPTCFAKNGKDGWQFTKLGRGDFDRFGKPYSESYVKEYGIPNHRLVNQSMFVMPLPMPWRKPFSHFPPNLNLFICNCMLMRYMVGSIQTGFKRSRRAKDSKKQIWLASSRAWMRFWEDCLIH